MINNKLIKQLTLFAIIINFCGLFSPALSSMFVPYYGSIAKHIVQSNNWVDLILSGQDWLDKPHLPFWLSAISIKLFGLSEFSFALPGFIFYIIGGYYTYKLTQYLTNDETANLATLFYFTICHLLLSSVDVRAEAFLLGTITPASYYWLLYNKNVNFRNLILGALFSGLALMTKGLFTIITIFSGVAMLWIYNKEFKNFIRPKWIFALVLCFVFALPEIICLYLQFDLHPEKLIFNQHNVSGVKWFFWTSQFGRFFGTGPITSINPVQNHWLYFFYVFLWAFLPWWPIFIYSVLYMFKFLFVHKSTKPQTKIKFNFDQNQAFVYLLASFWITFIMFTLTKFQVDHYTNIIFPFAAIICSIWITKQLHSDNRKQLATIFWIQYVISYILIIASVIVILTVFKGVYLWGFLGIVLILIALFYFTHKQALINKIVLYPTLAILLAFSVVMVVNGRYYAKYDALYQVALYMNKIENQNNQPQTVIGFKLDPLSLEFNLKLNSQYLSTSSLEQLNNDINQNKLSKINNWYVILSKNDYAQILSSYNSKYIITINKQFNGCDIGTFMQNIINANRLKSKLTTYYVLRFEKK